MSKYRNYKIEIAAQFGRHSVDVMKKNYLQTQQKTNALDAFNFIREVYDANPFDEKENFDPFLLQKQNLQILKKF